MAILRAYTRRIYALYLAGRLRVDTGGTFLMGSPPGEGWDDESPQHQVTVSSFYLSKYQVTQGEYTAVMGTNPSGFKGADLPAEQVSWLDAIEYCNLRSRQEGLTPAYTYTKKGYTVTWDRNADGYRLPTEAEWEYAARGGTASRGYTYAGSNDPNAVAWYDENSGHTTHAVGTKAPNELGLYDMSGNVGEWCWDCFGAYPRTVQTETTGVYPVPHYVNRGGNWQDDQLYLRSSHRDKYYPRCRYAVIGFRLARKSG